MTLSQIQRPNPSARSSCSSRSTMLPFPLRRVILGVTAPVWRCGSRVPEEPATPVRVIAGAATHARYCAMSTTRRHRRHRRIVQASSRSSADTWGENARGLTDSARSSCRIIPGQEWYVVGAPEGTRTPNRLIRNLIKTSSGCVLWCWIVLLSRCFAYLADVPARLGTVRSRAD